MGSVKIDKTGILIAGDEIEIPPAPYYRLFSSLVLLVEVPATGGQLIARIQEISGATPSYNIEASISAGQKLGAIASGSVPIAPGSSAILRIISAPTGADAPSYLQAFLEFGSAEIAGSTFATLGQLKAAAGVTGPASDGELNSILLAVTREMQHYMGRVLLPTLHTAERCSVWVATMRLALNEWPILIRTPLDVTVSGEPLTTFTVNEDDAAKGFLYLADGWPRGDGHIEVTYESGYDPVPADLAQACIDQARMIWADHKSGGNRFGESSRATEGSGTAQFMVTAWHPRTMAVMNAYRRMA